MAVDDPQRRRHRRRWLLLQPPPPPHACDRAASAAGPALLGRPGQPSKPKHPNSWHSLNFQIFPPEIRLDLELSAKSSFSLKLSHSSGFSRKIFRTIDQFNNQLSLSSPFFSFDGSERSRERESISRGSTAANRCGSTAAPQRTPSAKSCRGWASTARRSGYTMNQCSGSSSSSLLSLFLIIFRESFD